MMKTIIPTDASWLNPRAPDCEAVTAYDQQHFLTYARLLDAERQAQDWREAAADILKLDVAHDPAAAEQCFRSHIARAHWIVGPGLVAIVGGMQQPVTS
jgi:hypothetical protein